MINSEIVGKSEEKTAVASNRNNEKVDSFFYNADKKCLE